MSLPLVCIFNQISQVQTFSSSFNLILIYAHLCLDLPSGLFFRTSTKSPSKYVYFVPSPSYLLTVIIYRRFWSVQKPRQSFIQHSKPAHHIVTKCRCCYNELQESEFLVALVCNKRGNVHIREH